MLTYIKIGIAGIAIAAIGYFCYTYYSRGQEVKTLEKENTQIVIQNDGLKDTVDKTEKSGAINESVVTDQAKDTRGVVSTQDAITKETEELVEKIKRESKTPTSVEARPASVEDPLLPVTPTDVNAGVNRKVSQVRIDGLWKSYCAAVPTNAKCVKEK